MNKEQFEILFLIARPAAGKSEIIEYLRRTSREDRLSRFRIGEFEVLDDFPMLWEWFEEDRILSEMSHPRLHSDDQEYFLHSYLWHVLIRRLAVGYRRVKRDRRPGEELTAIVEFSRGTSHGGYREAFRHFPEEMLRRGAIVYVKVSYEESVRKNRRRFNPDRPDSVLEHSLPEAKIERLYRYDDWVDFSAGDTEYVMVNGIAVPYAVFDNEDDVTTGAGEALGSRLEHVLGRLWDIRSRPEND